MVVSVCAGGVSVARPGLVGGLGALKNHKVFVDKGAGIEDAWRKGEAAHERRRGGASPISTSVFGVEVGVSCAPGAMSMDMALLSCAPGAMSTDFVFVTWIHSRCEVTTTRFEAQDGLQPSSPSL